MSAFRSPKSASRAAEHFVSQLGITDLPVDPMSIARDLGIDVYAKPAASRGVSGMLIRHDREFAIAYATHIKSEGFQRFSVGHEIGHYKLPGHVDHLFSGGETVHESRAGFVSGDPYELEADHYSAGLLMPESLFSKAMQDAGAGLDAVETLSNAAVTSLEATAIRYAQLTSIPAAIVISTGQTINYCFMSKALEELDGLEWIHKSQPVPADTATERLNADPAKVARADRDEDTTNLSDWFGGDWEAELYEEVKGLGSYGKTLTVLYALEDLDQEEASAEADLEESYEVRFRKR